MSGYPYYGGNPQYPPPQNQIYPQMYNPVQGAPQGQAAPAPAPGYPTGQTSQYPFQPGFAVYPTPTIQPHHMGQPTALSYPTGFPSAPSYAQQGVPVVTPQPGYEPIVEWVPSTPSNAHTLSNRAVVAGYEGHDNSPLWIIRARHEGDLIPGKLAIKHRAAYIPWGGKEVFVQNIEVCCARPEKVRWVQSSGGNAPPNAIVGGNTSSGEPLYIGRAREQGSLTPGKVHPSHKNMYISFAGKEIAHGSYEVLCTV